MCCYKAIQVRFAFGFFFFLIFVWSARYVYMYSLFIFGTINMDLLKEFIKSLIRIAAMELKEKKMLLTVFFLVKLSEFID